MKNMPAQLPNKFPRISRFITEKDNFFVIIALIIILIAFIVVSIDTYKNARLASSSTMEKQSLLSEERAWKQILNKYPDYKNGYLALSVVEYRLGESKDAWGSLNNALRIDPNYAEARSFEEFLAKN